MIQMRHDSNEDMYTYMDITYDTLVGFTMGKMCCLHETLF